MYFLIYKRNFKLDYTHRYRQDYISIRSNEFEKKSCEFEKKVSRFSRILEDRTSIANSMVGRETRARGNLWSSS